MTYETFTDMTDRQKMVLNEMANTPDDKKIFSFFSSSYTKLSLYQIQYINFKMWQNMFVCRHGVDKFSKELYYYITWLCLCAA